VASNPEDQKILDIVQRVLEQEGFRLIDLRIERFFEKERPVIVAGVVAQVTPMLNDIRDRVDKRSDKQDATLARIEEMAYSNSRAMSDVKADNEYRKGKEESDDEHKRDEHVRRKEQKGLLKWIIGLLVGGGALTIWNKISSYFHWGK